MLICSSCRKSMCITLRCGKSFGKASDLKYGRRHHSRTTKGRAVCPNTASPKIVEPSGKEDDKNLPKHVMYGIEAFWIYKHAWRGAGLYYRSGDHQVPKSETANKPTSMYKALSMYPVWDKWLMPRCEPIAERFYNNPKKWSISSYDDDDAFGGDVGAFGICSI